MGATAESIVRSVQVGTVEDHGTKTADKPLDRQMRTAYYKEPVEGEIRLDETGLVGDEHASASHGGPDKAVCVYPHDHYGYWEETYDLELEIPAFGENFTTVGLTETEVCIGDVYEVGDAVLQVTQPRGPCWKIARRWGIKDLPKHAQDVRFTGWHCRVLREGFVEAGQRLVLVDRPHPAWSVDRVTEVRFDMPDDRVQAGKLAALPELGSQWRAPLRKRAEHGVQEDPHPRLFGANE